MNYLKRLMISCLMLPLMAHSQVEWNHSGSDVYLNAPYSLGIQTIDQTTALGVDGSINASEYLINGTSLQTWSRSGGDLIYTGSVGIGSVPNAIMSVKGTTLAEKVIIDLKVPGPDYVFEETYFLTPLKELEAFINTNKHLPYLPAASEMKEEGINIGDNQMALLQTIEELMLHQIAMQESLDDLAENQQELTKRIDEMDHEEN